ncbi:hypothetical protein H5W18_02330 [Lactobacillus sp. Marseille-P7033]|nr:hypothetical protein [Lactobacillus sp. Marseille-P7033]NGC77636.1 hypothetical protein [Limosilactobacillus reuteri]
MTTNASSKYASEYRHRHYYFLKVCGNKLILTGPQKTIIKKNKARFLNNAYESNIKINSGIRSCVVDSNRKVKYVDLELVEGK